MQVGDIAFTRLNVTGRDGFSFVALTDIAPGQTIFFSSLYWKGTQWLNDSIGSSAGGIIEWTTSTGVTAGGVVNIDTAAAGNTTTLVANTGTVQLSTPPAGMLGDLAWNLRSAQDSVLAFTGTITAPSFIAGITSEYNSTYDLPTGWIDTNKVFSSSVSGSELPSSLTNGTNALAVFNAANILEFDNVRYLGSAQTAGTKAQLLASINNWANWEFVNTTEYALPASSPFTVVGTNATPTLSTIQTLANATEDTEYSIAYADLLAASNYSDTDAGDPKSFRIEAISSGTLTKAGISVTGGNLLSVGETLKWTPAGNANGNGLNAFTVKAWDGMAASASPVQVKVNVAAVNDAPILTGGGTLAPVNEDTANPPGAALNALGIVADDSADGGSIAGYVVFSNTANAGTQGVWQYSSNAGGNWSAVGTVSPGAALLLSATTLVRFVPAADFSGTPDSLGIHAVDNSSPGLWTTNSGGNESRWTYNTTTSTASSAVSSSTANITISITAVNDAPTAIGPGSIAFTEDTAGAITGISFADVDAGSSSVTATLSVPSGNLAATSGAGVTVGGTPSALTLTGSINNINTFIAGNNVTYTSATNASGSVTLTVGINDGGSTGSGGAKTGSTTVTLDVAAVNDAPSGVADSFSVAEGGTATTLTGGATSVLANDSDIENSPLTAVLVTGPANGTLTLNSNGTFSYVHNGSETTTDSFTYKPNDGTVNGNTVTVTITVTPVNDAPVAAADAFTVAQGGAATVLAGGATSVLANDSDAEGNTLTAVLVTGPAHGSLALNANGTFHYTHSGFGAAADSFTYRANDGSANSNVTTVAITVTSTNSAPTVANAIPNQSAITASAFNYTFAANTFADVDVGDTLGYSAQLAGGGALPAWLSFDPATRTFSGTPAGAGTVSIEVIANDGHGASVSDSFDLVIGSALPDPVSPPAPVKVVDGVPITTAPGPGGSTVITIPVVAPTRSDSPGTSTPLADIPLVTGAGGQPIVSVSVPAGVGLTAEGLTTTATGSAALAELGFRIERVTGTNPELTNAGNVFYATLGPNEPLNVQIIKPTIGAGYNASQPLVINGSTNTADGKQAVIIDARSLPSGTVIQVDNIEFVAVVGDVRLVGGAGQNMASGDGSAQWIVLGPDDDIIHGGGGNDTVGSEAGDDQVYGDAGDDIVFGGAGNDLLSGGTGSDRINGGTGFDVAIQEGARTDYTVTLDGAGIKLTHTASGVSDWLVDVEQVRFATGPSLTVAHSAAEEAGAYLFQKWLGRDLNQGEGALIQTLTGKTALEVAALFAQLFPEQSAGKTPAQLLEGMAAAGAVRVDAVREVTVTGDAGNNSISPALGLARFVDGGAGIDTVVFPATLAQTFVQATANGASLQRMTDGAMLDVTRVERITFNDTKLALDLNGNAGQAAKLLGALAGPGALSNKGLVGEVIRLLDAGATSQTIAGLGLQLLGANTAAQVAQLLWINLMGRAGTDSELKLLKDMMAGGVSAGELTVMAANLEMNATRIDLVGLAAKGIEFA